jgi:hypothetical protein
MDETISIPHTHPSFLAMWFRTKSKQSQQATAHGDRLSYESRYNTSHISRYQTNRAPTLRSRTRTLSTRSPCPACSEQTWLSGEEEGPPEVVDELADLLGLHGDEVLVAALLAVLLLEYDCWDTPGLALLGGQVPPRGGAWHGEDHLVVLGVRARVVGEVAVRRERGSVWWRSAGEMAASAAAARWRRRRGRVRVWRGRRRSMAGRYRAVERRAWGVGSKCWLGCEAHGVAGDRVSCGLRLKAHLSL